MANFSVLERFEIQGWQNDECLYKYVHVHNKQNTTWKVFCTLFNIYGLVFVSETHLFAVLTHSTCDLLTTCT